MQRILCILLFEIAAACALSGQGFPSYFHHLTVADGLSQGTNHFIYKDTKGFVWLSSLNGLNRFDGKQVKVYRPSQDDPLSLFGQNVQSLFYEDQDANLWFATYEGINCYVRKYDHFLHFTHQAEASGDNNGYYAFHLDPYGKLWLLIAGKKLYHFDTRSHVFTFQYELPLVANRASVLSDRGEVLRTYFYYLHGPGLLVKEHTDKKDGPLKMLFNEGPADALVIRKLIVAGKDTLWMATDKGLALYLVFKREISFFNHFEGSDLGTCISLERVGKNQLAVAFSKQGLFLFDQSRLEFVDHATASNTEVNDISTDDIAQIISDRDGSVWLASNNQGVDYYHPGKQKFDILKPKPGQLPIANFEATSLMDDSYGRIWCGTRNSGIVVYDPKDKSYLQKNKMESSGGTWPFEQVVKIFPDQQQQLWILSWEGLAHWSPFDDRIRLVTGTEKFVFLDGCQLQDGRIVLSELRGGIYQVIQKTNNDFSVSLLSQIDTKEPFTSLWVNNKGHLFGCRSLKTLWVFDPANNFDLMEDIPLAGQTATFCEREGDPCIWAANSYGLARLVEHGGKYEFNIFGEDNGLPTPSVHSLLPDAKGQLWLSTDHGISRFDPSTAIFKNYGIVDGVSSLQFNPGASLALNTGEFLFGSASGVTVVRPENVVPIQVKAHPTITEILINDQRDTSLSCSMTGATNPSEVQRLVLDYQRNTISFSFAALEYSDPSANEFMYQMQGVDKGWVKSGRENIARYARLPAGEYILRLKASNADGIWSQERQLSIYIEPPFTQTPLFYFLMGVAAMGLVWLVIFIRKKRRERLRQVEEEKRQALEQERQRIARDVHDDLGSGLSALSLLTEIAKSKSSPEELKEEIDKINSTARDLSTKIREVIWTVNARNDSIASLFSYLNQYAVELFDSAGIDCQVSLPEKIPANIITGEHRRTLFLGFKEALNNILKHAGASAVTIDFSINDQLLRIVVADNGKGFNPSLLLKSKGNGLLNMQARMRDVGGDCEIRTDEHGTQVAFSLDVSGK